MRLRKLALAVGLAGTLSAQMASALGLGEIKLHSKLNEPLNAEIRLLQVRELAKNEVLVDLASSDDFKQAGIDRVFFLSDLRFEVVLDAPAGPVIRVTSQKPVKEPYLNFLLESQWPNGRILREYTLLMDLPTFSEQSAAPVQSSRTTTPVARPAGVTASSAPRATQAAAPRSESPAARSQASSAATAPAYQGDVYGPVAENDTLWQIALKVRPNREYSVQQTMLALQRLNPDAFINGNINLLRQGQVLRVPASADIDSINSQQAIAEVGQQNSAWSELRGTSVGPQLEGSTRQRSAATESPREVSGRLTVAGANTAEAAQSGRAAGEVGGDAAALQNDLAVSLEELDSSRRENAELKDRITEMEDQIQTMERLLEVSSDEFRALQQSIAARGAEDTAEKTESLAEATATDPLEQTEQGVDSAPTDTGLARTTAAAQPPVAQQQPQAVRADATKVVRSAPKEPSFMDLVVDNLLYIGAALLAILAAIWLLVRRRKAEDDQADGFSPADGSSLADGSSSANGSSPTDDGFLAPTALAAGAVIGASVNSTADDHTADAETVADNGYDTSFDDVNLDFADVNLADEDSLFGEDSVPVQAETGDAVAEADIYIAYGKLDQAEDLLQKALEQDPSNTAARLKLMEVFLDNQQLDKFDQQYGEVMAWGNAGEVDRAESLRQQFADAPAYLAEGSTDLLDNEFAVGDETFAFELDDDVLADAKDKPQSDFEIDEDFGLNFETTLTSAEKAESALSDGLAEAGEDDELSLDLNDLTLSDDDDFFAALDDADKLMQSDAEPAPALDLPTEDEDTLAEDELAPINFDEKFEALDELDLDLELDGSDDDNAFDLDMDELDLAALDEEVNALSASIDFAGEELASDDELTLASDEVSTEDRSETEQVDGFGELALEGEELDLDGDLREGSLDEISLDEVGSGGTDLGDLSSDEFSLEELSSEMEGLPAATDEFSLDLDDEFSAEFTDELALESEGLELKEVPTLSLDDAPLLTAAAEEEAELPADTPAFDELDLDDIESEEFDLAADLGLDEGDFAAFEDELQSDDSLTAEESLSETLSQLPTPEDAMAGTLNDDELDAELDFLADTDEAATKLDLARAYIDMGDQEGAKDILGEVVSEGNDAQKHEAEEMLKRMG